MNNGYALRMKELAEKRTGLKLEFLKSRKYEEGKTYYCGYWEKTYKVLEVYNNDNPLGWGSWAVTVEWADGHKTTHCTSLDLERDFLVVG